MISKTMLMEKLEACERSSEGGHFTQEEAQGIVHLLKEMQTRLTDFNRLEAARQERLKRANLVYKRSNPMPPGAYPELSDLIDWLLDRSGRREAQKYRKVLLEVFQQIDNLSLEGFDFDKSYGVSGRWLLHNRILIHNVLHQPVQDESEDDDPPSEWYSRLAK